MNLKLMGYCWSCGDPIYAGDYIQWLNPLTGEELNPGDASAEPFHDDMDAPCAPHWPSWKYQESHVSNP